MNPSQKFMRRIHGRGSRLAGLMLLLAGMSCMHSSIPVADEGMPAFPHKATDPHCFGQVITGPTVIQGSIWFVEVQLAEDPMMIFPAITWSESGLDTGDVAALWFFQVNKTKYFPIGDMTAPDYTRFYNPIVLAEKPHPEWTERPSHPVYCPRKEE